MGWKEFYKIDEKQFSEMFNAGQNWGDMYPIRVTTPNRVYYGAGAYTQDTNVFKLSPKIAHPLGVKTRIKIKYLFLAVANAPVGSGSSIGIVFYKNGETSKDPQGNDFHGIQISLVSSPPSTYVEEKQLVVEQANNRIALVYNDRRTEYQLNPPLSSFALAVKVDNYTGIAIYEVIAEYYDEMEDIFNMIFNTMIIVMFVMMGVMLVSAILRAFRGGRSE